VQLQGKVAIITGGGTGIGKAVALRFAQEGARLALAGRRPGPLEATAAEIQAAGGQAITVPSDVTDAAQVMRLIETTVERLGGLDILINNAGGGSHMFEIKDMPRDEWDYCIAINLTSAMLCSQAALKVMLPQRSGAIVNVGSRAGKDGLAGRAHYSAAKFGLIGLTQGLAREVGPHGIRVNTICPSAVLTEGMEAGLRQRADYLEISYEETVQSFADRAALRRVSTPEDAAALILFLASDESKAMTGQAINLTSGLWMS
jgi:NAD(P)-dependent dehydrogenase (short-subunit alcohol dehydrogenase family)